MAYLKKLMYFAVIAKLVQFAFLLIFDGIFEVLFILIN